MFSALCVHLVWVDYAEQVACHVTNQQAAVRHYLGPFVTLGLKLSPSLFGSNVPCAYFKFLGTVQHRLDLHHKGRFCQRLFNDQT